MPPINSLTRGLRTWMGRPLASVRRPGHRMCPSSEGFSSGEWRASCGVGGVAWGGVGWGRGGGGGGGGGALGGLDRYGRVNKNTRVR